MRVAYIFAALLLTSAVARAQDAANSEPTLRTLHGMMITLLDSTHGIEMEVWAKGDNFRSEITNGDAKIIVIQLGDTMYTYSPGKNVGQKTRFEGGLASHGLIEQIALVKAKGKIERSQVVEGIAYDQYAYDVDAPQEQALVLLEAKTSLPKDWFSVVKLRNGEPSPVRIKFRDMQANVDVPDELFELPKGVNFAEISADDLMSTPIPRQGTDDSAVEKSEQ